jgi:hypothetical protein
MPEGAVDTTKLFIELGCTIVGLAILARMPGFVRSEIDLLLDIVRFRDRHCLGIDEYTTIWAI